MTIFRHNQGNIPVISISGENLPEAWENAMLAVWEYGVDIQTEYENFDGFLMSKDATVMIEVSNPFNEPRIHKNFPGGFEELEIYRQEIVKGIHNHWVSLEDEKWSYTYNDRLQNYKNIDQIEYIINKLIDSYYSRRCQAITWMPTIDSVIEHPPCLQRLWCRLLPDDNNVLVLNMNSHWRSRDLYNAWFMNAYVITDLQRVIAREIEKRMEQTIKIGRYVDISDSLHIYSNVFEKAEIEIEKMKTSSYLTRAWESTYSTFVEVTKETRAKLWFDVDFMLEGH